MSLENAILENTKALEKLIILLQNHNPLVFPGTLPEKISKEDYNEIVKEDESSKDNFPVEEKPKRTRKAKNVESVEITKERIEDCKSEQKTLTHDFVKEFAQLKVVEGFDRVEIKKMINSLGFDKISDMSSEALSNLYNQLLSLSK